jgi:hypothetical protein
VEPDHARDPAGNAGDSHSLPVVAVRLLATVAAVGAVAGVLYAFGVAGFQGGEIIVPTLLAITGGATAWWALRCIPGRPFYAASLAALSTLLTPVLVASAPWSTGELEAQLDRLKLPFAEQVSQRESGHSWCQPTCPVVTRVYLGPAINAPAAAAEVLAAIVQADIADVPRDRKIRPTFVLVNDDVRLTVKTAPEHPGQISRIRITIRAEARR